MLESFISVCVNFIPKWFLLLKQTAHEIYAIPFFSIVFCLPGEPYVVIWYLFTFNIIVSLARPSISNRWVLPLFLLSNISWMETIKFVVKAMTNSISTPYPQFNKIDESQRYNNSCTNPSLIFVIDFEIQYIASEMWKMCLEWWIYKPNDEAIGVKKYFSPHLDKLI